MHTISTLLNFMLLPTVFLRSPILTYRYSPSSASCSFLLYSSSFFSSYSYIHTVCVNKNFTFCCTIKMVLKYKSVHTVYYQIQLQRCKNDMRLQCCSNGMVTSYIEISRDHNDSSTRLTEMRRWCTLSTVSKE